MTRWITPSAVRPNWSADPRLAPALLVVVALVVWARGLSGPFQFDDWNVIVEQPAVHSLAAWWASMPGIRPLLKLSYALDWQAGGASAFGFRLTNLLLHAANVLLAWLLLRRWPGVADDRRTAVAGAAALVFALHPVQAESVTYISGRSTSMMATFWLAAMLCWLKAGDGRRTAWRVAALGAFFAAVAVRETALALPAVLLLWHRADGDTWRVALRRLAPMGVVLAAALLAILATAGYRRLLAFSFSTRGPFDHLALQVDALAYLPRPLLLLETNIDPMPAISVPGSAAWWATALAIAGLLAAGFALLRRAPAVGLAILWPFAVLLPTHSLVPRLDLVADRHLYLALLGPAVLAGMLAARLPRFRWRLAATVAAGLALAVAAAQRVADFDSETALWSATAKRSPLKARVWNNLGYGRLVEGDPAGAAAAFRRALELDPADMKAAVNLGRAEALQGMTERRDQPATSRR